MKCKLSVYRNNTTANTFVNSLCSAVDGLKYKLNLPVIKYLHLIFPNTIVLSILLLFT